MSNTQLEVAILARRHFLRNDAKAALATENEVHAATHSGITMTPLDPDILSVIQSLTENRGSK
jgi:hypothetical protein